MLTDFGLAKLLSNTSAVGTKTMLAGSPGYQAPEQLRAESLGPLTDVYSFGGVMTVCMQKQVLWPGLNCYQIMQKVTSGTKPNIDKIPVSLRYIADRCFDPATSRLDSSTVLQKLYLAVFQ